MNIRREPALALIAVVAPAVSFLLSLLNLSPDVAAAGNAVAVAAAGLLTGVLVVRERLAPALLGLGQAVLTLAVTAGLNLDSEQQAGLVTIMGIVVGAFVRTQVDAEGADELAARRARRAPAAGAGGATAA